MMKLFGKRKRVETPPVDPRIADTIVSSGLFDPHWYRTRYPETDAFRAGPLAHFCQYGLKEHRDPGPNFDTKKYLLNVSLTQSNETPPFLYALAKGFSSDEIKLWLSDDRDTLLYLLTESKLFDRSWYLQANLDVAKSRMDPEQHFVDKGIYELRDPGPDFDTDFYQTKYPEFDETCSSPLEHYLRLGQRLGCMPKDRSKYERWVDAFDTLTEADQDNIRLASNGNSLQQTAIVFILDNSGLAGFEKLAQSWCLQIGVRSTGYVLRSASLAQAEWQQASEQARALGVSACETAAEALANIPDGSVILLCNGPVLLRPHTVYAFTQAMVNPNIYAAYADHDWIDDAGVRAQAIFKPAMSPEFMRQVPYAGSVIAARLELNSRSRFVDVLTAACSSNGRTTAAEHWAQLLLAIPYEQIARIPFVLWHRVDEPPSGIEVTYEASREPRLNSIEKLSSDYELEPLPKVRIIIPTRDHVDLLRECVETLLAKTRYPSPLWEIVIVDNGSEELPALDYLNNLHQRDDVHVIRAPGQFNFSKICNAGAVSAQAEILVFLNNDMSVIRADWLDKIVGFARAPDIGCVGANLLYPDDTVQHGGVVLGLQGVAGHHLAGVPRDVAQSTDITRELAAVTGACLALRRSVFEEVGGFDEVLKVAFNDVKLCASVLKAGYRNIYIADPLFYHHESKSRGYDDSPQKVQRNLREATYFRERFSSLIQDDPSYSPNLSLVTVGQLAFPPRVIPTWRHLTGRRKRVLLLSVVHGLGHGVAIVLAQQAAFLRERGFEVWVGGPEGLRDIAYPECHRVSLKTVQAAATFAVREGMDCVIVHTPPFFSITRFLGQKPAVYFFDHGEPPPHLFSDRRAREAVDWEKRFCAPLASRVFTISRAVYEQQFRRDAVVIRNGNSHLSTWTDDCRARRQALRAKFGFVGRFVILNVCRFNYDERHYKGIDQYMNLAMDASYLHPRISSTSHFVLAGRGKPDDQAYVETAGIEVFANITDQEMIDLYIASDMFISLSQWEGYNLGIGQARAMGLPVVASDIEAHREFGVMTTNSLLQLASLIDEHINHWDEGARMRQAIIEPWDVPLDVLATLIENDCSLQAQDS